MGFGAFGLIALVGYVGSVYKEEGGVPIPTVLTNGTETRLQLYEYLVYDKPSPWAVVLKENYMLWFTLYSIAHLLMYVEPQRNLFRPWKLNKDYPNSSLLFVEFIRSARSVLIASLYEIGLYYLIVEEMIPRKYVSNFLQVDDQGTLSFSTLFASGAIAYLWGDAYVDMKCFLSVLSLQTCHSCTYFVLTFFHSLHTHTRIRLQYYNQPSDISTGHTDGFIQNGCIKMFTKCTMKALTPIPGPDYPSIGLNRPFTFRQRR